MLNLRKITPVNGFDSHSPDNARQNNYAWSMVEFGDYIYVGTGRNIVYLGLKNLGLEAPDEFTPEHPTMAGEIWRYPIQGNHQQWQKVFSPPVEWGVYGFRNMIVYRDETGVESIIVGANDTSASESYLFMTTDGLNWERLFAGFAGAYSPRSMVEFKGTLYCGASNSSIPGRECLLYSTRNVRAHWQAVAMPTGQDAPDGEIISLAVFNGSLYIGTALPNGFGVWKTDDPASGVWTMVVDQGAGDALNEVAMTMAVFEDHLYVGSAIWMGIRSVDPDKDWIPLKGFDIVRINRQDEWELIVGSAPILPTNPKTGKRGVGYHPSGFGNLFNAYCWQMHEHDGQLYVSSWDSALAIQTIIKHYLSPEEILDLADGEALSVEAITTLMEKFQPHFLRHPYRWLRWMQALISSLKHYPQNHGFDCLATQNGRRFHAVSRNGFGNPHNYGLRTMLSASNGKLYFGTANPFEGCEVWELNDRDCCCCC